MSKQTAVEWLKEVYTTQGKILDAQFEQAKAMESKQREKMFSKEEVIAIVRKSIATGLTAEYLILALKGGEQ